MGLSRKDCERLGLDFDDLYGRAKPIVVPPEVAKVPRAAPERVTEAGEWFVRIDSWTPPSLNHLIYRHWATASKAKKAAMDVVVVHCLKAGVPKANGKRRVTITITVANRGHTPDGDNVQKVIHDALVRAEAIVDDHGDWCEMAPVEIRVGKVKSTEIRLEAIS